MKIIIYTLEWCPHCQALKSYLKKRKLEFENIDVEKNEEQAEYIIKKTGLEGFPIIDINGEIIIGFDKEKIDILCKGK